MILFNSRYLKDQGFAFKSKLNAGVKENRPFVRYKFVNNAGSPKVKYGTGEIPLFVNCKFPLIKVGLNLLVESKISTAMTVVEKPKYSKKVIRFLTISAPKNLIIVLNIC